MASADLGVNVGIAGNTSIWHATGVEKNLNTDGTTDTHTEDGTGVAGYTSYFIEKTLGSRITIGYEYTPDALSSDTATNEVLSQDTATREAYTLDKNTVQIDFDDLHQTYVALNLNENFYAKYGWASVDVITNENLATGSTYGNTSLDGSMYGVGYNRSFDNGFFFRAEGVYMDFDSVTLTSNDNTVSLNGLEGASAKLALGKSF
ncbi:hypothetical protein N9S39_01815 [Candidatus Pelagibacter sp.]|nr:hypothetical protein [Candidatus Pelagibacter sp.]